MSSYGVGPESNQKAAGYPGNIGATTTPTNMSYHGNGYCSSQGSGMGEVVAGLNLPAACTVLSAAVNVSQQGVASGQ